MLDPHDFKKGGFKAWFKEAYFMRASEGGLQCGYYTGSSVFTEYREETSNMTIALQNLKNAVAVLCPGSYLNYFTHVHDLDAYVITVEGTLYAMEWKVCSPCSSYIKHLKQNRKGEKVEPIEQCKLEFEEFLKHVHVDYKRVVYIATDGSYWKVHDGDNTFEIENVNDAYDFICKFISGKEIARPDLSLDDEIECIFSIIDDNIMRIYEDEYIENNERKQIAAYWSNISKACKAMRNALFYNDWSKVKSESVTKEELLAIKDYWVNRYFLDPSVGGGSLLIAALYNVLLIESAINKKLGLNVKSVVNPSNYVGIELNNFSDTFFQVTKKAIKVFADNGYFDGKVMNICPMTLYSCTDALEVDWYALTKCPPENTTIVANPPFTAGRHLSDNQKYQLSRYGLSNNLDAAFMVHAAKQGYYGWWIVNSAITITQGAVIDKVCYTIPGEIHYGGDSNRNGNGGIISNGDKTERWMVTSAGTGGNLGDIRSITMITDWAIFDGSIIAQPENVEGDLTCTYGGRKFKCTGYYTCDPSVDYILPQKTMKGSTWTPIHPALPNVTGNLILKNPTSWTLQAIQSRAFHVWCTRLEPSLLFCGGGYLQCTPNLSRSIGTFPLFQGDDLDRYETMTDDEIFQELLAKYNKLINKD